MKVSKRSMWISLALFAVFVMANLLQVGRVMSGHYDWVCEGCRVGLYHCPFKKITYLEVPATYEAHSHSWTLAPESPSWSPWKPWQWFVYLTTDAELLRRPDPRTLFQSTCPQLKYSDEAGLRKLASDPHYARAKEIKGWLTEAESKPE